MIKGSEVIQEFLISEGIPIARLRNRLFFTPYEQRIRIMEENSDKPEEFRTRSLRRRLTKYDRAISDDEAYALDRAFTGWLILNGKAKSVDPGVLNGAGTNSIGPLTIRELAFARLFQEMKQRLAFVHKLRMEELFRKIAPWAEGEIEINILESVKLAKAIKKAYDEN